MTLKFFPLLVWALVALYIGVVSARYCKEHYRCPSICYSNVSHTEPCDNGTETSNCTVYRMEAKNCTKRCSRLVCCKGFEGENCTNDIDECLTSGMRCQHSCRNTPGSYRCICRQGFYLNVANGRTCFDIDECDSMVDNCGQYCKNTRGSFKCYCDPGYKLDADMKTCIDIDECDSMVANCSQRCRNTRGSFKCYCDPGYKLDADLKTCIDINECEASPQSCSHNCTNTRGSFRCSCDQGFELDTDFRTCVDIDECDSMAANCSQRCRNTRGSFKCYCDPGYKLDADLKTCIDTNECEASPPICSHNCTNTRGSFSCSCDPGFELDTDRRTCVDIDECDSLTANCSQRCRNTRGSFRCYCDRGFKLDADMKSCNDTNECEASPPICSHNCTNTRGSFRCSCGTGFELDTDRRTCVDIDECPSANCSHVCHNTKGSFKCSCNEGYQLDNDSRTCIPICYGDTVCPNGGICAQPDVCQCKPGFAEPLCEDIDECSIRNGHCDHICRNLNGTYTCVCVLGFKLDEDGRTCSNLPIDGGYTGWSAWSQCSMACGSGMQERSRSCTNPVPEFGGQDCEDSAEDFRTCNMDSCLECLPNGTIHLTNPDSSVYTQFTAVYDVDGTLTNCTATADVTLDNAYFDCAKTTSTVTIYINHRAFTWSILSTKSRIFETQCLWANLTSTAGLGSRIDEFTESPVPTNNITARFLSRPDEEVNEARVGDTVYFVMTSPAAYDLFPVQCNVTGRGNQYKSVISDGCSKYPNLMTSFNLQREHPLKMYNSKLTVFQFYESDTLTVTCDTRLCENSRCPINCDGADRTRRDVADQFDVINKEEEKVKTIRVSRRLKIVNSEQDRLSAAVTISSSFALAVLLSMFTRLFAQ